MDPTQALGVVHADQLARIIERVQRSPTGGRYVAACASHSLRRRLEDALRQALGADSVFPVEVDPTHPWNTVRQQQLALGRPLTGTLWTWWGLDQTGNVDPYLPLNFARDGMASTGTHNLFWLDGVKEIGRFIEKAPDLWSYRSGVGVFVSIADARLEEPAATTPLEAEIVRAEARAADIRLGPVERAKAYTNLGSLLQSAGRRNDSLLAAEAAVRCLQGSFEGRDAPAWVWANALGRRVTAIRELGRVSESNARLREFEAHAKRAGWAPSTQFGIMNSMAVTAHKTADHRNSIRLAVQSALAPAGLIEGWPRVPATNAVLGWLALGRARAAGAALENLPAADREGPAGHTQAEYPKAGIAWITGEPIAALSLLGDAARPHGARGNVTLATGALHLLATALWTLGLPEDWLILTRRALSQPDATPADHAAAAATLSNLPNPPPEAAEWLDKALADLDLGAIDAGEEKLARIEELVRAGADASGATRTRLLETSLVLLKQVARPKPDPYGVSGYRDYLSTQALVELGRFDEARAPSKSIIAWARHHRGVGYVVDGWLILARTEAPATALRRADEALTEAKRGEDLHREIMSQQARAKALVALRRVDDARAALEAALAAAKAEGLRPREQELSCDLAELPEGAERARCAQDAVWLAREMMFPREEARALLALANVATDSGERDRARARAQMWTAALGPLR